MKPLGKACLSAHTEPVGDSEVQLNDPFGRVSRRQQQAYVGFRKQLRQQGIDSASKVRSARTGLTRTTLRLTLLIAALFGGTAMLFPGLKGVTLVTAGLVLVWLASSFLQTRAHLNNYLNEMIDAEQHDRRDQPTPPDNPAQQQEPTK